jgi:hypothetical protein
MTTTTHRRLLNALFTVTLLGAAAPLRADAIVVTTTTELEAALSPANAGMRILVRAGEYEISQALTVPDDATLVGEGEMIFDESGVPTGFAPNGRTVIRSTPTLVGDVLTLGDGATLRGLVIEDALGRQGGNPVVVSSRAAGDFISALLDVCEIINPNPAGIVPAGPTGSALVAITRNPNLGQDPPAHEGAVIRVEMRRSIVRSPSRGNGVFAINFASHSEISLVLQRNVIGGGLVATGGVSRPDAVTGASVSIESRRNVYWNQSGLAGTLGWNLIGGAGSPAFPSASSTLNRLRIHSEEDTIQGFRLGIVAIGGQRFLAGSEPSSSNSVEMRLHGLHVQTTTEPLAADLVLFGARSFVNGVPPGDGNTLHVVLRQSTGSGPRANAYGHSSTPSMGDLGVGNQLEIVGTENAFVRSNDGFEPIPATEFFTAQR